MNKYSARNVALLSIASVAVALAFFGLSSWLAQLYVGSLNSYYAPNSVTPYPPSEIAGGDAILLIIGGAIFLLGSGGISRNTASAALRASVASALGKETVGPAEMMRRDAWRPKGHILLGLTVLGAGIFLIVLAFLLAYIPL
jgi:hypothetical protein